MIETPVLNGSARREEALLQLAKMDKSVWAETLRTVTEIAAVTLGVPRASVWLFDEDGTAAVCEDLYDARMGAHERGMGWKTADFPVYVRAMREKRTIAAVDALTDPETVEFAEGYLIPLGITAMLDVSIWHRGRLVGVLCHEDVDGPREWTARDQDFAASVGEVVALALEARERVRAEEALRLSEQRFRTLFEQFPLSIQILEPSGHTLQVNQAFEALFGIGAEQLQGYNLLEDPQLQQKGMIPLLERGFQGHPTVIPAVLYERPGGHSVELGAARWIQGFIYPVKDHARNTREVIVVHQDITERREAEREIQSSQERFKSAFERSSIGMALIDLDDRYIQVNQAFCKLFGYTPEEMLGRTTASVSYQEDLDRLRRTFSGVDALNAGTINSFQVEKRYRRKDGSLFWALVGISLVQDSEGNPLHHISQVQDITERKRAEEELQRTYAELEARVEQRTAELAQANAALEAEMAERERSEQERLETATKLEAIFRALPDLYFHLDAEGTILEARAGAAADLDTEPVCFVGRRMQEFLPPESAAEFAQAMQEVAAEGKVACIEYEMPVNGKDSILEARLVRLRYDCGAEIIAIVRDVTDRVAAERALQRSEAHFRTITENASDVITITGPDTLIRYQSPAAERLFGYSIQEMKGTSAFDYMHPDDREPTRLTFLRALENPGSTQSAEFRFRAKDGRYVYCETVGRTMLPDSPEAGVVTSTRDISERRRSQEALRESEERLRFALSAGGMGAFEWHIEEGRIAWSPAVEVIHGRVPGTFDGTMEDVLAEVYPDDRGWLQEAIQEAVEQRREFDVEYRIIWPDSSLHWLGVKGRVIWDAEGHPLRMVGVCMDITARKEAEDALRQAAEAASAADRAKSEFLSRMSHELRTPLNSILGFAQVLGRKALPPDQVRSVDYILKAGRHLLELINEVLDIARIESNRQQLSLEPVALGSVTGEALSLIQPLASQRGVRVLTEASPLLERFVRADRQRLTQVLLNLLSNAVKYNREGGMVFLTCASPGDGRVAVQVRDTGLGIPAEKMGQLFTPFERLGAEQSDIEGTGLGLALSLRLVEAMGGTVTAESTVGEGSLFTVTLLEVESPLERLGQPQPAPAVELPAPAREKTATLLYIEDNLANLSLIETILGERSEIALLSTIQGRLGVDLAWEHQPDVVLLDLHLPDMTGEEVLRRLKAESRTREIPVVVISADATPRSIERLLEAGAHGYLPKPLDVDQFLKTIDEILEAK